MKVQIHQLTFNMLYFEHLNCLTIVDIQKVETIKKRIELDGYNDVDKILDQVYLLVSLMILVSLMSIRTHVLVLP